MLDVNDDVIGDIITGDDYYLVGGFNPSEKYWSIGMIIPNIWRNKKCSKPPTSYGGVGDGDGEADEFSDFRGRQSDHNSPRAPPQLSFSFHPGGCRGLPPSVVENGPLKRRNECGIV